MRYKNILWGLVGGSGCDGGRDSRWNCDIVGEDRCHCLICGEK